jgi:hypothetical protein
METAPHPVNELGLVQRIWGTLVAPRVVFRYLDHRPRILGALLVLCAVHVAASLLVGDIAFEAQARRLEANQDLSEEQLAQTQKTMEVMHTLSPVMAAAWPVIVVYVSAAILLLITNLILRGSTSYRHLAAASAHVGFVSIPMFIVQVPLVLAKHDVDVRTSLAAFLPRADDSGLLFHLLSQFDVFFLWKLGLTVLAVAILARVPVPRAAYGIVGAWVVWLLISVPISTVLPG